MTRYACPVCGDPNAFPLWVSHEPPAGCPDDDEWLMHGRAPSIRTVTECKHQMGKARQSAEFRTACPDAFDETGTMKPGQLERVLRAWSEMFPGQPLMTSP